jgi:hypothetical protein
MLEMKELEVRMFSGHQHLLMADAASRDQAASSIRDGKK